MEEEEEDGISLVRQGTSLATFASSDKLKTAKRENRNKPKSDGRARESFNCEKSHDLLQCGTARLRVASGTAAAATLAASGRKVVAGGRWYLPFECCSVAHFRYRKEANVNGIDDNTWAPRLELSLTAATAFQLQVDVAPKSFDVPHRVAA